MSLSALSIKAVPTPHGSVSVTVASSSHAPVSEPSTSDDICLLLLHSNSSCSRAFKRILNSPPSGISRVVAPDNLGHGLSPNATGDISSAYSLRGFAESTIAVLLHLKVTNVIVFGWSLGGHIAIEMLPLLEAHATIRYRGVMIVGSPPCNGAEETSRGFDVSGTGQVEEPKPREGGNASLGAAEVWSEDDAKVFTAMVHGPPIEPWMLDAGKRTDGRARRVIFGGLMEGTGVDERKVLAQSKVPCAVVNGANEPFVNLDYVDEVTYGNLWERKCHRMSGTGHAPFWEKPEEFAVILQRFVKNCVSIESELKD